MRKFQRGRSMLFLIYINDLSDEPGNWSTWKMPPPPLFS